MQLPVALASIPYEERRIAIYARLSTAEQAQGQSLKRQLFDLTTAVDDQIAPVRSELIYSDLDSGRNAERADYLRLMADIEAGLIHGLAIDRIDRINRSVGQNDKIWYQFSSLGIHLYIVRWGKFVDWDNYKDWGTYTGDSVASEAYSRELSYKLSAAHRYGRHEHKPPPGKPPFGYRRGEGCYELDPETMSLAKKCVAAFFSEGGYRPGADFCNRNYGTTFSPSVYKRWLNNPVLRGHTEYFKGSLDKRPNQLIRDTHPEDVLLTDAQYIELQNIAKAPPTRPNVTPKNPISSLCYCGLCGGKGVLLSWQGKTRSNRYITCRNYRDRKIGTPCGERQPRRMKTLNYIDIEAEIITAFTNRAADLIAAKNSDENLIQVASPEQIELEGQIEKIQKLASEIGDVDGGFASKIKTLRARLRSLDPKGDASHTISEEKLKLYASDATYWIGLTTQQKLFYYPQLIDSIIFADGEIIDIRLTF